MWWLVISLAITLPALKLLKPFLAKKLFRVRYKFEEGLEDYESDLIYLHQFPRWIVKQVPNLSPFAMKLETWLRMKRLKYKVVDTLKWSERGQSPFINLNGRQVADSHRIIEHLTEHFKLDPSEGLSDKERGASRAIRLLVEGNFCWTYFYFRYVQNYKLFYKVYQLPNFSTFVSWIMSKGMRMRCYQVGVGRNSPDEMYAIGGEDIRAISRYLGDNDYICGTEPTMVDCCVFGHLAQIAYVRSMPYPHRAVLETECLNVVAWLARMKERFWLDWNDIVDNEEFETVP